MAEIVFIQMTATISQNGHLKLSSALTRAIADAPPVAGAVWVDVEEVEESPYQFRSLDLNDAEMKDLVLSVIDKGVLQPVLLRPIEGKKYKGVKYQLVAGHRRWFASREAANTNPSRRFVMAIVREISDIESAEIALIENVQRVDPSDWVIAQGIKKLMDLHAEQGEPISELGLAKKLHKTDANGNQATVSPSYVRNHLALFKLRPQLQEVAQRRNQVKSALLEIQKLPDGSELEEKLIEQVDRKKPASFSTIKQQVDSFLESEKNKRESFRAPDAHTQSRADEYSRNGTPNVSRGRRVTGTSAKEANTVSIETIEALEYKTETLEHWIDAMTDSQRAKIIPRIKALSKRLEGLAN